MLHESRVKFKVLLPNYFKGIVMALHPIKGVLQVPLPYVTTYSRTSLVLVMLPCRKRDPVQGVLQTQPTPVRHNQGIFR